MRMVEFLQNPLPNGTAFQEFVGEIVSRYTEIYDFESDFI